MQAVKMKLADFHKVAPIIFREGKDCTLNLTTDRTLVAAGLENEVDVPCETVETLHRGGVIVAFPESVTIFDFRADQDRIPDYKQKLVDFLKKKGLPAEIGKNDVLVDQHKVCGDMRYKCHGLWFYGIHISIRMDLDVIHKVCKKSMVKIPRGLSYYGITRQEVLEAIGISE